MDSSLVTTSLLAVAIVFPVLATASVGLRFWALSLKSQPRTAGDWTIVLALLMCWAIAIDTIVTGAIAGIDTTTMDPLAAATLFLRSLWIEGFPLGIGLAVIKISILLFYKRIFVGRTFVTAVYIMIAALSIWATSTVFAQLFAANPISGAWNPLAPTLVINYSAFAMSVAGISLVFDVMVLCFPLPVISRLHMPTGRKVAIAGIFLLGAFCCVAASIRFYILYKSIYEVSSSDQLNRYQDMTNGFIWSNIEPNCSVIAACLPTYGPIFAGRRQKGGISFFSSLRARILSLSGGSSKGGSKGSKGGSKNSSGLDARGHLSDRLSSDGSETLITSSDLSMNNHHHSNSNSKNLGRHVTMIKSVNSLSHDDDDNTYELQHGHEMPARTHHDGWQKISDVPFSGGDNSVHITSVSGQQQQQESFEGGDLESQHPAPMRIEVTKVFGNQYQRA